MPAVHPLPVFEGPMEQELIINADLIKSHIIVIAVDCEEVNLKKQQLGEVPKKHTIFRLPAFYNETNEHLYEPKMVAIGPYHHHKESLKAMEQHKLRSLKNIIGDVPLSVYIDKVKALEESARDCYSEHVDMESADFVRMLVIDGCFIIDYFNKRKNGNVDPIFNVGWAKIHLYSDLFLLENQIPFFVIHDLYTMRYGGHDCQNRENNPLLILFCGPLKKIFSNKKLIHPKISCKDIHHLLQLYYQCMVPPPPKENHIVQVEQSHSCWSRPLSWHKLDRENDVSRDLASEENKISCVNDLHEAGVTFRKKKNPDNMFNITFKNGTMEMPFVKVEDTHKVILLNMVAFEQSQLQLKSQILSSYLALMDSLINTEKDVAILVRDGVVENYLRTNEDAAELFNQFAKSFKLDYDSNHFYKELFQDVNKYSNSRCHKYRARLKHDYFRNPWTTISVISAGLLLLLTALQTYNSFFPPNLAKFS